MPRVHGVREHERPPEDQSEHAPRCPTCGGRVSIVYTNRWFWEALVHGSSDCAEFAEHCNLCGRSWTDYDQEVKRAARWRNKRGLRALPRAVLFPNPPASEPPCSE